ncbi:MAG: hypothetical protein OXF02_06060 [Simkaniaceae bacterium]|nr:hypothetical protein [Simkaniaceae bacterium]
MGRPFAILSGSVRYDAKTHIATATISYYPEKSTGKLVQRDVSVKIRGRDVERGVDKEILLLHRELPLLPDREEDFVQAVKRGNFGDGYTSVASHYFKAVRPKEKGVGQLRSFILTTPTVGGGGDTRSVPGRVSLKRGNPSRVRRAVLHVFKPGARRKEEDRNRATIGDYQRFLRAECGERKMRLIEKTFGFSLDEMKNKGEPLLPKHIYYFNIGMNDVEMEDVRVFADKMSRFLAENDSERVPTGSSALSALHKGHFTLREVRGILRGFDTPWEKITVGDIAARFGDVRRCEEGTKEPEGSAMWNRCIEAVMVTEEERDNAYTGRKFRAPIAGSYNGEVGDSRTFRPWIDMHELAQANQRVLDTEYDPEDPKKAERVFNEYLAKVAVKKHLMRCTADRSAWRIDSLIPSPFIDKNGERVWYRAFQGTDSGHGKFWIALQPVSQVHCSEYPVYRVTRDTCPVPYAQRGGATLSRCVDKDSGYKYSNTTDPEDRAFFDRFTIPVWMGYLLKAKRAPDREVALDMLTKATCERITEMHERLDNHSVATGEDRVAKAACQSALEGLVDKVEAFFAKEGELTDEDLHGLYLALRAGGDPEDIERFDKLLRGEKPPAVSIVGNSLGGFDAQYDVIKHTALRRRIPIVPMAVYTHSTLRVREEDNKAFMHFIDEYRDVMQEAGGRFSIDHITEETDPVSLFGQGRTFLGGRVHVRQGACSSRGARVVRDDFLNRDTHALDATLRVVRPLETSMDPHILKLPKHCRLMEGLKEGHDFTVLKDYDDPAVYAEEMHTQKADRFGKVSIDGWHRVAGKFSLSSIIDVTLRVHRFVKRSAFLDKVNRNRVLRVRTGDSSSFRRVDHWEKRSDGYFLCEKRRRETYEKIAENVGKLRSRHGARVASGSRRRTRRHHTVPASSSAYYSRMSHLYGMATEGWATPAPAPVCCH